MFGRLLVATSIFAVVAAARADISAHVEPYYEGYLSDGTTHIYCYDLMVEITGADAWTVAGGPSVGQPWIELCGAVFYQAEGGTDTQPDPAILPQFPDLEYDTFYTTPLGWPNTEDAGISPQFSVGPIDFPDHLIADWWWVPDANDYPGDFTIARFTVIAPPDADPATTYADIDMVVGSREVVPPIAYTARVPIPEPASLALLALGGLALLRRR
jgi:hypothetical protein